MEYGKAAVSYFSKISSKPSGKTYTVSKFLTFLLKKCRSGSYALSSRISFDSFDMFHFEVSKFEQSDLRISCVFGFLLYQKHQENPNKLTLAKTKVKLSYNTLFGNNASVV